MSNWVGYAVSVNCGEPLGCYQGTIIEADGLTISLTKPFRNGFPYPKSQVTLNAADIKELKIIESRPEPSSQTHSTVPVTKASRRTPRATVCENLQNLQANQTGTGHHNGQNNNAGGSSKARNNSNGALARSKPIDIQGNNRGNKNNSHINNHSGGHSGGGGGCGAGSGSTPRGRGGNVGGGSRGEHQRRRNEACFGEPLATEPDFDFEKNLALFDKQALWEQMRTSGRPDVVPPQHNYAPTENVLSGGGGGGGGTGGGGTGGGGGSLVLPALWTAATRYVTDEGRRVPAATAPGRRALWSGLQRGGGAGAAAVLLARAAADVALRLVGGERRLEHNNTHQQPALTVRLAPASPSAAAALAAARLLASHGARVALVLPPHDAHLADPLAPGLPAELALRDAGVSVYKEGDAVPRGDLALLFGDTPSAGAEKATLLVEPGAEEPAPSARATIWALVPGAGCPAHGHVYLANVAPPPSLYERLGVSYSPPFGAAHLLTLHLDDD